MNLNPVVRVGLTDRAKFEQDVKSVNEPFDISEKRKNT